MFLRLCTLLVLLCAAPVLAFETKVGLEWTPPPGSFGEAYAFEVIVWAFPDETCPPPCLAVLEFVWDRPILGSRLTVQIGRLANADPGQDTATILLREYFQDGTGLPPTRRRIGALSATTPLTMLAYSLSSGLLPGPGTRLVFAWGNKSVSIDVAFSMSQVEHFSVTGHFRGTTAPQGFLGHVRYLNPRHIGTLLEDPTGTYTLLLIDNSIEITDLPLEPLAASPGMN